MGLYNMIFGESGYADQLLSLLGLTKDNFYRYRDCYRSGDHEIAVYTRGGGNNRLCPELDYYLDYDMGCTEAQHHHECVVAMQQALRDHPLYLRDEDDDFDNTYSTFYFGVPEDADLEGDIEDDRNKVWLEFLEALNGS